MFARARRRVSAEPLFFPVFESQVNTDPHSPARQRVNGTLANVPAAAQAFSCAPGTPLAPLDPCAVW